MTRKLFIGLVLLCVVLFTAVMVVWGQPIHEAELITRENPQLTIYTNSLTLIQDTRQFRVEAGLNQLAFEDVAATLDESSVIVRGKSGLVILQQRYLPPFTPAAPDLLTLLKQNIREQVRFTTRGDVTHEAATYEGTLLSVQPEILLRLADATLVTLRQEQLQSYRLPHLETLPAQPPTLNLIVEAAQAGDYTVSLTYLASGMNWNTEYSLLLGADQESLAINGWITLSNFSGATFTDAKVMLAVGTPPSQTLLVNRDEGLGVYATATALPSATATANTNYNNPNFQPPTTANQIYLYEVPQALTLAKDTEQRIEFIGGRAIATTNRYVYDASPRIFGYSGFITSPSYGLTGITGIQNYLEISTAFDDSVGIALPEGQAQLYKENAQGFALLLGSTRLPYTPQGETLQIFLENSTYLQAERRQTEFQILSESAIQESFELRLTNRGTEDVTITIPERMSRSVSWEIMGSSVPYEQPNPFGIEFVVKVPAGGETLIAYTVLYTRSS